MKIKGQRYYKGYDDSTWVAMECPMIEVHPGVRHGSMMLREIGNPRNKWLMTDAVFFNHLNTRFLQKIEL